MFISTSNVPVAATFYINGFQYLFQNTNYQITLQFVPTSEGYYDFLSSKYVYQYKDHLGNVRLSYKDVSTTSTPSLQIVEENNYYLFGLKQKGYNNGFVIGNGNATAQKYKYNGKELQDELGLNMYDYGARNYDPALGRWMNVDPKAETSRRFSPYTYALNNPIFFIDPDGMKADDWVTYTGENGQKQVVYDEEIKSKDQAEAKYKNVSDDFKSGSISGTSPEGSDYSYKLNEDGSVVDAGGANVDKGFTTPQGTYVGENKSALSQLAPVVSNTGDAAVVAGSLMVFTGFGAPIGAGLITYGTYTSVTGTTMGLVDDANKGKPIVEKALIKGALYTIPFAGEAAFARLGAPAASGLFNIEVMGVDKGLDKMRDTKTGPYKEK